MQAGLFTVGPSGAQMFLALWGILTFSERTGRLGCPANAVTGGVLHWLQPPHDSDGLRAASGIDCTEHALMHCHRRLG
jgi:hypothetical protein